MVTVTLDEVMVNAITAALDDRVSAMRHQVRRLRHIRADLKEQRDSPDNARALRDNAFALEATEDAIRDAVRATLTISAALPFVDFPVDAPFGGIEQYQAESR